jgi:diguanylate cyclase (GGDEF)-like protein
MLSLRTKITIIVLVAFSLFIFFVYGTLQYLLEGNYTQVDGGWMISAIKENIDGFFVGQQNSSDVAALILLISLPFFIILPIVLQKKIFGRLDILTTSIGQIAKTQDLSGTLLVSGNDEIAVLTRAINDMLFALSTEKNFKQQALKAAQERNKNLEQHVKEKTTQLRKQLYTDQLTTTPNRLQLIEDMKEAMQPCLAIINVEQFRTINEFYGYQTGDDLLQELAERLVKLIEPYQYQLYRLAGDEYAVFADGGDENLFSDWMLSVHNIIEKVPFKIHGHNYYFFVTVGIAITKDEPLEKAQMALEYARQCCLPLKVYHDDLPMREAYRNNLYWIHEVQDAIQENRVMVYYQPIMNTLTSEINKYEVLVRLLARDGQIVLPGIFLPIIKKTKLYPRLTEVVIEKSFAYFVNRNVDFTINLSAADILDASVQEVIWESLAEVDVAKRVTFEFVESEEFKNPDDLSLFIQKIKECGAKIAIDDFGSGYSNFAYILNMEAHYIKIDGSLISEIDTNPAMVAIVESIVHFAKQLGIKTIAEYVSSEAIFLEAKRIGLDYLQGYYIGKPKPYLVEEASMIHKETVQRSKANHTNVTINPKNRVCQL